MVSVTENKNVCLFVPAPSSLVGHLQFASIKLGAWQSL